MREPSELKTTGFIAGAFNIPLRSLLKNLAKLPADQSGPIITYCTVGRRGAMATEMLRLLGYTNVHSILGGLNAWTGARPPTVK